MMKRFPEKARVCFVGDSITASNIYVAHIAGYYRDNFPESAVEFYNCGISGATLKTSLAVFDEDILPFEPTHIVLMSGINDSHRHFLERPAPDRYDRMREAFELYTARLDIFAERVKKIGAELILCTPMPYDEYLVSDVRVLRGCFAAMLGYAEYVKGYAREHGYALCDYHSSLTREITLSDEPLFNPDRVHPTPLGHYHMARCFLESQGIELPFGTDIPDSVRPWHDVTLRLRNTVSTENFILRGDFSGTDEDRMRIIRDFSENPWDDSNKELFLAMARDYPENKRNQRRNTELVLQFMKNPPPKG